MANSTLSDNAVTIATSRYFMDEREDWEKLSHRVGGEVARAENGYGTSYRDQFADHSHRWQDHDVHGGVGIEPEEVLKQHRVAA